MQTETVLTFGCQKMDNTGIKFTLLEKTKIGKEQSVRKIFPSADSGADHEWDVGVQYTG